MVQGINKQKHHAKEANMSKYNAIKTELKALISESRQSKSSHKEAQRALAKHYYDRCCTSPRPPFDLSILEKERSTRISKEVNSEYLRYFHLAYGLLRGRTIEQMEPKVAQGNEALMSRVQEVLEDLKKMVVDEGTNEAVHAAT